MSSRKPDLHIVARFLERMAESGQPPWTRSRLQRAVRLNYDLFRKYLDILLQRGWIEANGANEKEQFSITPAGVKLGKDLANWLATLFGQRL